MIALVALVCAAPFVSAWVAYYVIKPTGGKSYGELLPVAQVLSEQDRFAYGGDALKGKWLLLQTEPADCDSACVEALYASRQARTMLGRDKDRVVRVLGSRKPPADAAQLHADLVVKTPLQGAPAFELFKNRLVLVDPLGNQVIVWPKNPDIKKMNQDLARLMRASRIG
jgi:hypothetical protein